MSTWVVGDVQGCFHSLKSLLAKIQFEERRDTLWFAGDLVNRGAGSLQVLRWASRRAERVKAVMGNHELGLLQCADGLRQPRATDTLTPILEAPDRDALLAWVRSLPLLHVEAGHVLVHAGLHPRWDLQTCLRRAADPDEEALAVFTRMRALRADGALLAGFAGPPEQLPDGCTAWFDLRPPEREVRILFGHWAALGVRSGRGWQSLDAGCVWGKELAAYQVETGEIVTVVADARDLPAQF